MSKQHSFLTVLGTLKGWIIKGNSGDYYISNPQNCPLDTPAYWRLVYQGDLWDHSWYAVTSVVLAPDLDL